MEPKTSTDNGASRPTTADTVTPELAEVESMLKKARIIQRKYSASTNSTAVKKSKSASVAAKRPSTTGRKPPVSHKNSARANAKGSVSTDAVNSNSSSSKSKAPSPVLSSDVDNGPSQGDAPEFITIPLKTVAAEKKLSNRYKKLDAMHTNLCQNKVWESSFNPTPIPAESKFISKLCPSVKKGSAVRSVDAMVKSVDDCVNVCQNLINVVSDVHVGKKRADAGVGFYLTLLKTFYVSTNEFLAEVDAAYHSIVNSRVCSPEIAPDLHPPVSNASINSSRNEMIRRFSSPCVWILFKDVNSLASYGEKLQEFHWLNFYFDVQNEAFKRMVPLLKEIQPYSSENEKEVNNDFVEAIKNVYAHTVQEYGCSSCPALVWA